MKEVFITGATGYICTRLIRKLLARGHRVVALVRKGSEYKVPAGVTVAVADPFDAASFVHAVPAGCVFVQLLGVAHPSPQKTQQFRSIDLRSITASADAAASAGVHHFVYVSVSMAPSRLMFAYQQVRSEGEAYCLSRKLNATFSGPGMCWDPVIGGRCCYYRFMGWRS